jgi:hypothetical protein
MNLYNGRPSLESKQCFCCDEEALDRCSFCMRPFCVNHRSDFDLSLCKECVGFENTHINGGSILEDQFGDKLKEKARKIVLTGEAWIKNRELISRLSDMELEAKLLALKEAVHEAELILDFRRITISQVENEKTTRYSKRFAKLRLQEELRKKDPNYQPQITRPPASNDKARVADATIKAVMKAFGVSKEQAIGMIYALSQKKQVKPEVR